jgi:hypothetical protein
MIAHDRCHQHPRDPQVTACMYNPLLASHEISDEIIIKSWRLRVEVMWKELKPYVCRSSLRYCLTPELDASYPWQHWRALATNERTYVRAEPRCTHVWRGRRLFHFLAFLRKIFTSRPFLERFQKMDPGLGAVDHGAELTCLGTTDHGAEVLGLKTISVTLLWNSSVKKFVCFHGQQHTQNVY